MAGPVVAAAVVFPSGLYLPGVDDSKKLTPAKRDELFDRIMQSALSVGVGIVSHEIIDKMNILNATFRAMHEAVAKLTVVPDHLLVDGNMFPGGNVPFTTVVGGDGLCFSIAAASIIAKVTRDRIMCAYEDQFPGYGFANHKGYATQEHRDAIVAPRVLYHSPPLVSLEDRCTEREDSMQRNQPRGAEATTRKKGISEKP